MRYSLLNRGGDKMVLTYASYLAENGHDVFLEANKIDTVFFISPKIKIVPITLKGSLGTILSAFFKKRPLDIVVADIIPIAFALYFRNRNKVVYFAQDYNVTHYRNPLLKFSIIALNFVGLSVFRIRTIAVSEDISRILFGKFNAKIQNVVSNGIDTSMFYPAHSQVLMTGKNGRKSILILSRSDPRKGFDIAQKVLIKVMASCAVPLEVWTVGETTGDKFADFFHKDFGYVPETTLRAIYSSADIFLYPSRSEGYGLMVIEAFACKCPVITTNAVPYAIHGVNAMVSKIGDIDSLADHVCRLLEFPSLAHTITANGYTYAQAHTLEHAKGTFENVLKNLNGKNQMKGLEH